MADAKAEEQVNKNTSGAMSNLLKILMIVMILITSALSMAMAYIMFAPDTFPKPFYLSYAYPTPVPTIAEDEIIEEDLEPTVMPMPEVHPGDGLMVNAGAKIINLADLSGNKYIRISVVLEFLPPDPIYFELTEEEKNAYLDGFNQDMEAKMPIINDVIITLLSTKTFDTIYTVSGKDELRNEIMNQVNSRIPEHRVIAVYFTEFVTQ